MSYLAPEGTPTASAEDIAKDLRAWPTGQDFPRRRPRGNPRMAPGLEVLSLAVTLLRHPDKMARPFLQTGTVPASPAEWN